MCSGAMDHPPPSSPQISNMDQINTNNSLGINFSSGNKICRRQKIPNTITEIIEIESEQMHNRE